jgi:murein DD-endopeptidase MepM/ murein hydrolase activator NlpD
MSNTKSIKRLAIYLILLMVVASLLMSFSNQGELVLGLPIDKKSNFLLESGYGERQHPVLGDVRMHTGIDLAAEEGVPVVATEDGVVIVAKLLGAWGNKIVVQHNDAYSTSYSHMKSMNVNEGDQVKKGQVIGLVGHTGLSAKNHLHFELLKNGKAIDPIQYLPQIK